MSDLESSNKPQEVYWQRLHHMHDYLVQEKPIDPYYMAGSTGRSIDEIASEHGYATDTFIAKLENKKVLDIGGGLSGLNYDAAHIWNIDTAIIAVDTPNAYFNPDLRDPWTYKRTGAEIVAIAQALPFADRSFDMVISTYALPVYATSSKQVYGFIDEAVRVLKPGGEFSMTPFSVWGGDNRETKETVKASLIRKIIELHDLPDITVELKSPNSGNLIDTAVIFKHT